MYRYHICIYIDLFIGIDRHVSTNIIMHIKSERHVRRCLLTAYKYTHLTGNARTYRKICDWKKCCYFATQTTNSLFFYICLRKYPKSI